MIFKENAERFQDPIFSFPTVTYLSIISNVNSTGKMQKAVTWLLHYKNKGIKIIGVDCICPIGALLRISLGQPKLIFISFLFLFFKEKFSSRCPSCSSFGCLNSIRSSRQNIKLSKGEWAVERGEWRAFRNHSPTQSLWAQVCGQLREGTGSLNCTDNKLQVQFLQLKRLFRLFPSKQVGESEVLVQ